MQKVFSARIDEEVLDQLDRITRSLRMTKRKFLEEAIRRLAKDLREDGDRDIWAETSGAWKRRETPEQTIRTSRQTMRKSFDRHGAGTRARVHR